jgi:hypothetical protein
MKRTQAAVYMDEYKPKKGWKKEKNKPFPAVKTIKKGCRSSPVVSEP